VYRINERRVSRQEILDLLAPIMASPGGYNFVMQGDVGFFVKMSPLDRRLVIDEMAGIAEYDEKKAKAVEELSRVEANLSTVGSVLGEISRRMEELRAQKEIAMRCKVLTAELEGLRGAMALLRAKKLEERISAIAEKQKRLEESISGMRRRADGLRRKEEELRKRMEELEEEIGRRQSDRAIEEVRSARANIAAVQHLMASTLSRRSELEKELERIDELISKTSQSEPSAGELISRFRELHGKFRELLESTEDDPRRLAAASAEVRGILGEIASVLERLERTLSVSSAAPGADRPLQELREERAGVARTLREIQGQVKELEERLKEARETEKRWEKEEVKVRASIERLRAERERIRAKANGLGGRIRELEARIREEESMNQELMFKKKSCEGELQGIREELKRLKAEPSVPEGAGLEYMERRAQEIEEEIRSFGEVNYRAIKDYREEEKRHEAEKARYDKLVAEKESILNFMREIDEKKKEVFMRTFNEISRHFSEIFSELSPGGIGRLVLEREDSPFEGGLDIIARPQGKNFVSLESLSGGEKALTALAFIFALQRYRPTMFYVMDEIDAHLDPQNRKRVAEMLRKFSRDSQILVITLHDTIMAAADRLFGITMEDQVSRVFSVELSGLGG
ncbi:MAG: AAA family ATPase, partial [Candidatus Hadarchaeales archaeon]